MTPRFRRREALAAAATALLPAVALGAVAILGPPSPEASERLFRADLAGLVTAAAAGGFLTSGLSSASIRLPAMSVLAGAAHAAAQRGSGGAALLALLVFATAAAASGLAAVGRRIGAPRAAAGGVGAGVLWVAMAGLYWADPVSAAVPAADRFPLRQAILHVDVATAAAYGAAGFDRFHEPSIYHGVPLATSLVKPPTAGTTGLLWLAVGVVAWLAGTAGHTPRGAKAP